jgi:IclR family acetate operon transcriptional repressor
VAIVKQRPARPETRGRRRREPKADKYYSRAIGKALEILGAFRRTGEPRTLNEVAREAGLAKSSAFRILYTLEKAGYLERTVGDRYALSAAISSLVPNHVLGKLKQIAMPYMKELSREFRETVSLAFLFENHIEVVEVVESPQKVQMGNVVGGIIPPHASSLGKSIAAHQPEARREQLLRAYGICQFTPRTVTDEVELNRDFELIRARGYAADMEESAPGGCCFGAPIFGNGDNAVAAVSISMPKMRFESQDRITSAVRAAAAAISSRLRSG